MRTILIFTQFQIALYVAVSLASGSWLWLTLPGEWSDNTNLVVYGWALGVLPVSVLATDTNERIERYSGRSGSMVWTVLVFIVLQVAVYLLASFRLDDWAWLTPPGEWSEDAAFVAATWLMASPFFALITAWALE
nr:hypothetical protein [uncultured Roseovarius sp.]